MLKIHLYGMQKRRSIFSVLALFLLFMLAGCASAPPRAGKIDKGNYAYVGEYLDWRIPSELRHWNVKGVSIAVVDDQRVIWEKGYGLADEANAISASPDTVYRVGSISKLLTATEVMRRVERREIDIDGSLSAQLPGFSIKNRFPESKPVTVRSMLAHHSGLPSDYLKGMWLPNPIDLATLQTLLRNESLTTSPQTQYKYSNLDYSMLGRLIEVNSKMDFATAMDRDLLQPLGMTHSWFDRTAQPQRTYAKGYRNGKETQPVGLRDEPAGALLSNAIDLAKFISFILADGKAGGNRLINADTLRTMFEPQFADQPLDFGHQVGLGWMLNGVDIPGGGPVAWHTGNYPGYFSAIIISRVHKLGVIILANGDEAKHFVLDTGAKALQAAIEAKLGESLPKAEDPPSVKRVDLPEQQLAEYGGDYVIFGNLSKITRDGNQLSVEVLDNKLDLIPVAHNRFVPQKSILGLFNIPLTGLAVDFTAIGGRHFAILRGLPGPFPFERIQPRPVLDAWRSRLGTYVTDESDNNLTFDKVELAIEHGVLVAKAKVTSQVWGVADVQSRIALAPISDNEAVLIGAEGLEGSVVTARPRNGVEGFYFSGYFFRKDDPSPSPAYK